MIKFCTSMTQTLRPYIAMAGFFLKQFFLKFMRRLSKALENQGLKIPRLCRFLLVGLQLLLPATLKSAEISLLPWQIHGWDAEFSVRHRETLKQIRAEVQKTWIDAPQSLDGWLSSRQKNLAILQKQRAQNIIIGTARAPFSRPVYLVPIVCPLGKQAVLALEIVDLQSQSLLSGGHILLPAQEWLPEKKLLSPLSALTTRLDNLRRELTDSAVKAQGLQADNAVKLQIATDGGRRPDEDCLSMMLSHGLLPEQRLLANFGNLEGTFLRDWLAPQEKPQRATRILKLDWGMQGFEPPEFAYQARWAEGVLATPIGAPMQGKARLESVTNVLRAPPDLLQILQETQQALRVADLPQVIHIDRAWAYLDRGRAYGLDINDRLYLEEAGRIVKGHVVGFFGPKLGLKGTSGKAIQEGAILYIRKGQRQVQVGDQFAFDPTNFPTPWPPVKQPSTTQEQGRDGLP